MSTTTYVTDAATLGTGLLLARLILGVLMVAHGGQKLFGWFGGYGIAGTAGFFEQLGFRPGRLFVITASLTEVAERHPDRAGPVRPGGAGAAALGHDRGRGQRALGERPLRRDERHRGAAAVRGGRRRARAHRLRAVLARRGAGDRPHLDARAQGGRPRRRRGGWGGEPAGPPLRGRGSHRVNAGEPASGRPQMQIGIDSFAAAYDETSLAVSPSDRLRNLVEQIEHADQVGLDVFGVGEHHRREFLDSAPAVILGAAAARTQRIRLTSAVTVLSAADPVRVFQEFATLDLLSQGRAEMVVGRGSFIEAFPLFGLRLEDYDSLFAEKLDLLLKIRENEHVHWSGKHRPALTGQGVYPRPVQNPLPIWLGVGGTPQSFARAGALGLPLMVAIIGGESRRFRPLVDLYRETGMRSGYSPDRLKVGVHALGYVAATTREAADDFFPGYARAFTAVGKERGWPPVTRAEFDAQLKPDGALLVGNADEVVEKIVRYSEALGGISRITFHDERRLLAAREAHASHRSDRHPRRARPEPRTRSRSQPTPESIP